MSGHLPINSFGKNKIILLSGRQVHDRGRRGTDEGGAEGGLPDL